MSERFRGCVVVGAGLAGATVVETLRKEGYAQPITLIGEESERPYERPGLSKGYLRDETPAADLYVHPADWYQEHEVRTTYGQEVAWIDRGSAEVRLRSGEGVAYEHLVLATGANPRTVPLPGVDLAGVHMLRRIGDSDALRRELTPGRRWVIVGAGWIGLEVAAAAQLAGCDVTVLEAASVPLQRVLGNDLGEYFANLHRTNGVDLRTGATVSRIRGTDGRVTGVETDAGDLSADLVLVAVGVVPETRLAVQAGLEVDNGVVVDEQLRSSDPAILAVGDVANAHNAVLGRRIRVEHWDNAIRQGQLAAKTILGQTATYDWQPYFYTDQYDLGMEYVGYGEAADQVTIRGDMASGAFIAFWSREEVVTAAMNVNIWDVNDELRALIGRGIPTSRLRDLSIPLSDL